MLPPGVLTLLTVGVHNLVGCPHPRERVAGDTCTRCGAVYLNGSGWARPTLAQAMAELLEAAEHVSGCVRGPSAKPLSPPCTPEAPCLACQSSRHADQIYQAGGPRGVEVTREGEFVVYDYVSAYPAAISK